MHGDRGENESLGQQPDVSKIEAIAEQEMATRQNKCAASKERNHDENCGNASDVDEYDYSDDNFEGEGDCVPQSARSRKSGSVPGLSWVDSVEPESSICKKGSHMPEIDLRLTEPASTRRLKKDFEFERRGIKPPLPVSDVHYKKYERGILTRFKPHKEEARKGSVTPLSTVIATTAKQQRYQVEMKRIVHEIALRREHKAKTLENQAKKLQKNVDILWEENRSLRRLHRNQEREMREMHEFVSLTNVSKQGVRRDVRRGEEQCITVEAESRKKNRKMVSLQNECAKYEKLLKLAPGLPTEEELQETIDNALNKLTAKEDRITELEKLAVKQENKSTREKRKENNSFSQLQLEIKGTTTDCDELRKQIKVAEKKLQKTNIYSRQFELKAQEALPALTWYPPPAEQTSQCKVKKWLNEVEDHM